MANLHAVENVIPTEAAVAKLRAAIDGCSQEELARLVTVLTAVSAEAASRLIGFRTANPVISDVILDVKEAAARLGMSPSYLYRNASKFPFTVRLGRRLLFSANGIQKFIERRTGK